MTKRVYHMISNYRLQMSRKKRPIEQICVHKKFTPICSKLIFRISLIKLAVEGTFKFNSRFLKQLDCCTMRKPLSVMFSDIYMVNMENDAVITSNVLSMICRWHL